MKKCKKREMERKGGGEGRGRGREGAARHGRDFLIGTPFPTSCVHIWAFTSRQPHWGLQKWLRRKVGAAPLRL